MNLIESAINGVPLIVIDGDLDRSSKQVVHDALNEIFCGAYPPASVLFDLTDCTFLDSGGISVLLYVLGQLPARGWLGVIGASAGANRVLTYTGFLDTDKVRFFSSPGDAAASLAREKKLPKAPAAHGTPEENLVIHVPSAWTASTASSHPSALPASVMTRSRSS